MTPAAEPGHQPQPRTGDHRPPAADDTLKEDPMARRCFNDDCQDENGPFVPTSDGDLCEDCWDAQDEDCE